MRRKKPWESAGCGGLLTPYPAFPTILSSFFLSLLCRVNDYCKSPNKDLSFLRTFIFRTWTALRNTPSSSAYCRSIFSSKNSAWIRDRLTEPRRIRAWIFLYTVEIRGRVPDTDPHPNCCPESPLLKEAVCTPTFPAVWCRRWAASS